MHLLESCDKRESWQRMKHSKAWLHFTQKDDNSDSCNVCKMGISSKGRNTSNMLKYLCTQHSLKFLECSTSAPASEQSSTSVTEGKKGRSYVLIPSVTCRQAWQIYSLMKAEHIFFHFIYFRNRLLHQLSVSNKRVVLML